MTSKRLMKDTKIKKIYNFYCPKEESKKKYSILFLQVDV